MMYKTGFTLPVKKILKNHEEIPGAGIRTWLGARDLTGQMVKQVCKGVLRKSPCFWQCYCGPLWGP